MPTTTDRDFLEMPVAELAVRLLGHGRQLGRPLGSDLAGRLVGALGGRVREVRVDRLADGSTTRPSGWTAPRGRPRSTPARATPSLEELTRPGG